MALIKCSECGNKISDKALICPHCGIELNQDNYSQDSQEKTTDKISTFDYIMISILLLLFMLAIIIIQK